MARRYGIRGQVVRKAKKRAGRDRWSATAKLLDNWKRIALALGVFLASAFGVDRYYAHQSDLEAIAEDISTERVLNRYDALRREQAALRSIPEKERRALTSAEKARLDEISDQINRLQPIVERLDLEQVRKFSTK